MDIHVELKKCNKHQLEQIYYDIFNKKINENILNSFREYEFITAEVILHLFHNSYNKHLSDEQLLGKFLIQ